jgi:hypothetical protein
LRRRHHNETVGQRIKFVVVSNKCAAVIFVGTDQPILDSQPLAQFQRGGLFRNERVRSQLDNSLVEIVSADASTGARAAFQNHDLRRKVHRLRFAMQFVGSGKSRDAPADHGETLATRR